MGLIYSFPVCVCVCVCVFVVVVVVVFGGGRGGLISGNWSDSFLGGGGIAFFAN